MCTFFSSDLSAPSCATRRRLLAHTPPPTAIIPQLHNTKRRCHHINRHSQKDEMHTIEIEVPDGVFLEAAELADNRTRGGHVEHGGKKGGACAAMGVC